MKNKKFKQYGTRAVKFITLAVLLWFCIQGLIMTSSTVSTTYDMKVVDADAHLEKHSFAGAQHLYAVYLCDTDSLMFMSIESKDLYIRTFDHIDDTVHVEIRYLNFLGIKTKYAITITADWLDSPVSIAAGRVATNKWR